MRISTFRDGFHSELSNRTFARRSMAILARRTNHLDSAPFWQAYHHLEEFNAPRFHAAARRLNIPIGPKPLTNVRGQIIGHTPTPLLRELLRLAYPRTIEYAQDLRQLRDIGPRQELDFLDYMVRQEDLQVRMMHAALLRNYPDVTTELSEFIHRESTTSHEE